ncbi:hypothetical protein DFJ74DRAFT_700453 [Hyaloraphidium curvatum]|nr:hypothetical protein DFJ74DRAFT_700453 [Hyaloraphidium curvatum]
MSMPDSGTPGDGPPSDASSHSIDPASYSAMLDAAPALDAKQRAHLRHFYNLATAADGVWDTMGAQDPGQEWLDAYRYQLAEMFYAASLCHFHRLPAARGYFKSLLQNLIRKMLRREVWQFWYLTSRSGVRVNPDIKELREPWADPVREENIMYSGHLLAMVALYAVLCNDDRYDQPGALTFLFDPIFWGMGPEKFEYSATQLRDVIIDQMERSGWLGCCCEPNMVFIVCNQFPLVAMKLLDLRAGTDVASGVQEKYAAAWAKKNWLDGQGYFVDWWRVQQDRLESRGSVGWSAWAHTFLNAWNPAASDALWPRQIAGWLKSDPEGTVRVCPPNVAAMRRARIEAGEREDEVVIENEAEIARKVPFVMPTLGYIAAGLSEKGPRDKLEGLLRYADRYLKPTMRDGGLYYPLNGTSYDSDGNPVFMDPLTGNAMLAYARLNVPDGMRKLYEGAWKRDDPRWAEPFLASAEPASAIDIVRCAYLRDRGALVFGLAAWSGEVEATVAVGNVGEKWELKKGEEALGKDAVLSMRGEDGELVLRSESMASKRAADPPTGRSTKADQPSTGDAPEPTSECAVCSDLLPKTSFPPAPPTARCSHPVDICTSCVSASIESDTNSKGAMTIRCPSASCKRELSHEEIRVAATTEVFERYDRLITRNALSKMPDFRWCINPVCGEGHIHEGGTDYPIMTCRACRTKTCFSCEVAWHNNMTCDEFQNTLLTDDQRATAAYLERKTKRCPSCDRPIEKNGGCDHLVCRKASGGCGHEFCWRCLAPFEKITRHGNHHHRSTCRYYVARECFARIWSANGCRPSPL